LTVFCSFYWPNSNYDGHSLSLTVCRALGYDTMTIFSRRHFHEQLRRHAVNQASKILQHGFQFDPVVILHPIVHAVLQFLFELMICAGMYAS